MIRIFHRAFIGIALALVAPFTASAAFAGTAAHQTIPAGYYVGPGDAIKVVLRVYPNNTALIGSILNAVTPQSVKKNATIHAGGFKGTLKQHGADAILSIPAAPKDDLPACQYTLSPVKGGWALSHETRGCVSYHGASWGFGTGQGNVLKKYAE